MLIRLKVSNFKSFNDEIDFNMISSNKMRDHKEHRTKIKRTVLLKNSVVYGANAAGKSNLIDVFYFIREVLLNGLPLESDILYCKNGNNSNRPSEFEIQFTIDKHFYAFGFSAILSKRNIQGEWLYELMQNGNAKCIYERDDQGKAILGSEFNVTEKDSNRFNVYSEDFLGNSSGLFISEVNRNKKIDDTSKLYILKKIYEWMINRIVIIFPDSNLVDFSYYYNDTSIDKISHLLQTFDTGIQKAFVKNITLEALNKIVPSDKMAELKDEIKNQLNMNSTVNISIRVNDNFINLEASRNSEPVIKMIYFKHFHSNYDFLLHEESDGTKRLFELLDLILSNQQNVYVVDELERSLHPKLTEHFLKMFINEHQNDETQLIFATHETSILDLKLFRRDEIWFVERDSHNNSKLYSLDRFSERCDKVLSKAYLEGRYGAIPILPN